MSAKPENPKSTRVPADNGQRRAGIELEAIVDALRAEGVAVPVLLAHRLGHTYGRRQVLDRVSVSVQAGEIVGLLGPNGAGKTTTMRLIAGLLPQKTGAVMLNGSDVSGWPLNRRARAGLGYLPQEPSVFRYLSVWDNVEMALQERGLGKLIRRERTEAVLTRFELLPLSRKSADSLSGGERRRLEIARTLALEPAVMLFDEPFAGLDPLAVSRLQAILRNLAASGMALLITDHNIRETLNICDRATIIREGHILVEGAPPIIAADPQARKHFLGPDFHLDST